MTTPSDPPPGADPLGGSEQPQTWAPAQHQPHHGGAGAGWAAPPGAVPPAWGPMPGQGEWTPSPWGEDQGPTSSDDTTWALLAHLSYFVLGLVAPLVIFLVKKDASPFVRRHAAEALNFHITLTLALLASFLLMLVIIGFLLVPVILIGGAVYAVLAALAASRGEPYRYPLTLRLVS